MAHIKNKDTGIECRLRKALWHRGWHYRKNYTAIPGKPDIVFTKYKLAVFCDSEFFHGKDWADLKNQLAAGSNADFWTKKIARNIERDEEVNASLRDLGWSVLRFWGKDIKKNTDICVAAIEEKIKEISGNA